MNRSRNRLPVLLALIVAVIAGMVGWRWVNVDLAAWQSAGYSVGIDMQFVIFCMVFLALATFVASQRIIHGPAVAVILEYSLSYPQAQLATNPTVGDITGRLEALGYHISAYKLDDKGQDSARAAMSEALVGNTFRLTHRTAKSARAGVTLRFAPTLPEAKFGTALVEATDCDKGPYNEMAMYAIRELGELLPELTYKTTGSRLGAETVKTLAELLPDRPDAAHVVDEHETSR